MEPYRRIAGPATRQRVRSTLRAALNAAIAQQLITFNPATHVEPEARRRPKALVWTEGRILDWKRTGEKPSPVMVWTPEHTGLFLDHVAEGRLYALFRLIAFRGLRRGEACGRSGPTPTLTGRVFTKGNGELFHPADVTRRFVELYEEIGLPPVRLHDLRHGAATLAHAAGADLKDIQEMLGRSSITITADTYTSLLPEADLAIAEAAARLVPHTRMPRDAAVSAAAPAAGETSAHAPLTQTAPDEGSEAE
ncbi:tyrosine recombinase XerC [Streptomyces sp. XD-27]|uniref:site-specific integrase n=1 Tax=Streptomyces sp. XD-27 TaxID=3062779 RepID=UPI0026F41677|nr:tyrosine-type recombinase/integrase [Streptomyces sp. XD-27]WKX72157.1 tyrosine-type recombinase/integrase [Streptomyces sp. XD-27]